MKKLLVLSSVMLVLAVAMTRAMEGDANQLDSDVLQDSCTIGVNHASTTIHDSPVIWKVRDNPEEWLTDYPGICWSVQHYSKEDWDDIDLDMIAMVHWLDDMSPIPFFGTGLNEAGVGTGQTLVKNEDYEYNNLGFTYRILGNVWDMEEVRAFLDSPPEGTPRATGCWGFIDKEGNASIFELDPSDDQYWWEFDAMDPDRESQGLLGFVVRANTYHKTDEGTDGTDDDTMIWRYLTGTENTLGLIAAGEFSEQTVAQSDSNDEYRLIRQSDKPWGISNNDSRDAMVIRGAAPGEHPSLATMWALLGNPSFSIAVPTWVAVSDIPEPIGTCAMHTAVTTVYDRASTEKEQRIAEEWVQAVTFPAEVHLFDMVNNRILPQWRMAGGQPPLEEMTRVEHRMAYDAYSVVRYLADTCNAGECVSNLAPTIDFEASQRPKHRYGFSPDAADADGSIASYLWDFGDGLTSTEDAPVHEFPGAGTYLVSVTVADNDGVTTTAWRYLTVKGE